MPTKDYTQAILILKKIETKYGSITKAPESDPDYRAIRKLYPESSERTSRIDRRQNKLFDGFAKGIPMNELAAKTHLSTTDIAAFAQAHHLQAKRLFKYQIIDPNGSVCYTTSTTPFIKAVFGHYSGRMTDTHFLTMRHYKIKHGKFYWYKIPDGSYYYLKYLDRPVMKNGLDSYIFPSTITCS